MTQQTRAFEQTLHHGNYIVRDHHVHGVRTLPGVTLLDMVYRLAPRCVGAGKAIELRRVLFMQPIVTSEDFDQQVLVSFTPAGDHWRVSVTSRKLPHGQPADGAQVENMACTLHLDAQDEPPPRLDPARFIAEAEHRVDMDRIYGLALQASIRHRSFMKTLGTVYAKGRQELMQLRLGDEAEAFRERFFAHPALLDGSTFAGQSIRVRDAAFNADPTPYIPFAIQRFRLYAPLPREIYTFSDQEAFWSRSAGPSPDVHANDMLVFDARGALLARFEKMSMKRIRSAMSIQGLLEGRAPVLPPAPAIPAADHAGPAPAAPSGTGLKAYIRQRIAEALKQPADAVSLSDNFYDLGMDSSQLLLFTKELESAIGRELYPTLLFEHSSIEKLAEHLSADLPPGWMPPVQAGPAAAPAPAAAAAAVHEVVLFAVQAVECAGPAAAVAAKAQAASRQVLIVADGAAGAHEHELAAALREGGAEVGFLEPGGPDGPARTEALVLQLIARLQQLAAQPAAGEVVLQVLASAAGGRAWAAALGGSLKTLSLEHPRVRSQLLLVDELARQPAPALRDWLQREAAGAGKGAAVLHLGAGLARRTRVELRPARFEPVPSVSPFKESGTYIIAGGLGGLGRKLAQLLAGRHRVKLALLGRSPPGDAGERMLQALRDAGSQVSYLPVDLGDGAALRQAVAQVRESLGPVRGVIHSAGVVRDQLIGSKDPAGIGAVLAPKMSGLRNLDECTSGEPLDFFVLFSSLSAVTGNIGQVDYAAANAYMDEFAHWRNQQAALGLRQGHALSLNWPLWADGGMSVGDGVERMLYQSSGLRAMPTEVGLDVMERAIAQRVPQVVVAYGERERILAFMASQGLVDAKAEPRAFAPPEPMRQAAPAAVAGGIADRQPIAIIGMAGRYPLAPDTEAFRQNLRAGRNCITPPPLERWKGHHFGYEPATYCRHGGFVDGIDQFDPMLFGIPPVRAQAMDPQARLFLQTTWEACEDAGFHHSRKAPGFRSGGEQSVGVFVGAFWSHYELFGAEKSVQGVPTSLGVSLSSISNTTSYCMNFQGPSVAVDTMCSSALTAVHMACESLRSGECHFAVAGGVNLVAHPHKFIFLQENRFLSSEGLCRSFGAGGDGYVPGEGVGAVMLTTLDRALALGYPIRAVIRGSAINHGGKTAGGTVPSPVAQAEVIADALAAASVHPRSVGYVEAHGTGTALGDPIEVEGLTKAFGRWTPERQFCAIGSSKSNIGHLEAAAGIAGLTKLVLQLQHGEIYPSLHAETLNPYIPFERSPFYVETSLRPWPAPPAVPGAPAPRRRALVSAFGASGSNACMVLEEHRPESRIEAMAPAHAGPFGIVLSARDPQRLAERARRLLQALRLGRYLEWQLPGIAYTLQVGREPMKERLAFAVSSLDGLAEQLQAFLDDPQASPTLLRETAKADLPPSTASTLLAMLADWVRGAAVDWRLLHGPVPPVREHLPTYPFALARYWIGEQTAAAAGPDVPAVPPVQPAAAPLPPSPAAGPQRIVLSTAAMPSAAARPARPEPGRVRLVETHPPVAPQAPAAVVATVVSTAERVGVGAPSAEQLQQSLVRSLAAALFMEPGEIDLDASFLDIGLDSIIAVQWMKAINAEFGTAFKATEFYQYPTIRQLAAQLVQQWHRGEPAEPASVPSQAAEAAPRGRAEETVPAAPEAAGADVLAIRQFLAQSLAQALFMDAAELDDDTVFTEFGLDSIIAVQWVKAVNAHYGTQIKATLLYEQPTLSALSAYLGRELPRLQAEPAQADAAMPPAAAPEIPPALEQAWHAAGAEPAAGDATWAAHLAYAVQGCTDAQLSLLEVAPGVRMELLTAGQGDPVVLLPPMGTLVTAWMHQVRELSSRYRLLVVHYPGHGGTPFEAGRSSFASIAEHVRRALLVLGIQQPAHVVGWSMGALIAQTLARQAPSQVRSLTLVSTPSSVKQGDAVDATVTVLGNLVKDFAAHVPAEAKGRPEGRFEFIRAMSRLETSMPYLEQTLAFDYGLARSIPLPALLVFGSNDQVIAAEHGLALAQAMPQARHLVLEDAGHYIPLQRHAAFNRALFDFFQQVEALQRPLRALSAQGAEAEPVA